MKKETRTQFREVRSLQMRRRAVAERQRMAGVALADWLRFNTNGAISLEQSASIQRYIAVEIERIERCTAELLEIDAEIEAKTDGMSEQMKSLVINEGVIF